ARSRTVSASPSRWATTAAASTPSTSAPPTPPPLAPPPSPRRRSRDLAAASWRRFFWRRRSRLRVPMRRSSQRGETSTRTALARQPVESAPVKAAVYYETGPPDVFRYEDVPDPAVFPGGVLVEVE